MTIQYDENGLIIQNLSEILDERQATCTKFLGDDFVISGESVSAELQSSDADRELAIQELLLFIAMQLDPDQAVGIWLDFICALNNIVRYAATKTIIPITVTGTAGTAKNLGEITIVDDSTDEYYVNNNAFILNENGVANVEFQATSFGPITALSSSTFSIKTPSVGIDSVAYNVNGNQIVGRNTETDDELRARRNSSVTLTATSVLSSIKANVQQVANVTQVKAYENDTLITANEIPGKAFEIVVNGGLDSDVANAIFLKKPAGIQAYGTTTVQVRDEDTNVHTIGFTRPTLVPVDFKIEFTATGTATEALKTAIKNDLETKFRSLYTIGSTVYVYNFYCVLNQYKEIKNVDSFLVKKHSDDENSWSDKIVMGRKELATLITDNITLTQV